jgi:DNA-binding LacI/PurR family transcriptional regulator
LITFNDGATIDTIRALRKIRRQNTELIGYSNNPLIEHFCYSPLTTIEQFPDLQGKKAAELLFSLIMQKNGEATPAAYNRIAIEPKLTERHYN